MALRYNINCCNFNNMQSTKVLVWYFTWWLIVLFYINTFECIHQHIVRLKLFMMCLKCQCDGLTYKTGTCLFTPMASLLWGDQSIEFMSWQGQRNNTNDTYPMYDNLGQRLPLRCGKTRSHWMYQNHEWFVLLLSVPLRRHCKKQRNCVWSVDTCQFI